MKNVTPKLTPILLFTVVGLIVMYLVIGVSAVEQGATKKSTAEIRFEQEE